MKNVVDNPRYMTNRPRECSSLKWTFADDDHTMIVLPIELLVRTRKTRGRQICKQGCSLMVIFSKPVHEARCYAVNFCTRTKIQEFYQKYTNYLCCCYERQNQQHDRPNDFEHVLVKFSDLRRFMLNLWTNLASCFFWKIYPTCIQKLPEGTRRIFGWNMLSVVKCVYAACYITPAIYFF